MTFFYKIPWLTFQQRFLMINLVNVRETETEWVIYTSEGFMNYLSIVIKQDQMFNMAFVDRYFNRANVIHIEGIVNADGLEFTELPFEEEPQLGGLDSGEEIPENEDETENLLDEREPLKDAI